MNQLTDGELAKLKAVDDKLDRLIHAGAMLRALLLVGGQLDHGHRDEAVREWDEALASLKKEAGQCS